MTTEPHATELTPADRARRLEVAFAGLMSRVHKARLVADAVTQHQKAAGQPISDLLALTSSLIDCELEVLEVSRQSESFILASRDQAVTPPVMTGVLH
jgi:hypothetical protein